MSRILPMRYKSAEEGLRRIAAGFNGYLSGAALTNTRQPLRFRSVEEAIRALGIAVNAAGASPAVALKAKTPEIGLRSLSRAVNRLLGY